MTPSKSFDSLNTDPNDPIRFSSSETSLRFKGPSNIAFSVSKYKRDVPYSTTCPVGLSVTFTVSKTTFIKKE